MCFLLRLNFTSISIVKSVMLQVWNGGLLPIETNRSLFMYMSRLEVEGKSGTVCLICYSPSLNIAHAIAQKLCYGLMQAGQPSNLMSSHGTSCLPQWEPFPASWPCHSPACVSSWKWGPAFATILRISSHGFAFPSWNKNMLRDFGNLLETTGIAVNKDSLLASPSPDVRASSL